MTREDVSKIVADIIRFELNQPELHISDLTSAREIPAWDSLAHIGIILSVEKHFKTRLKAIEVAGLDNVGSLVDFLLNRIQADIT